VKRKDDAETLRAQRIRGEVEKQIEKEKEKEKRTGLRTGHYKEEDYD
jgi:hypothetical protein